MATTIRFPGSGPGPQTLDGCSAEFWKLLPAGAEPSLIASTVPSGGSILELGAGVGRVTYPLLELGYRVTAVDNSSEMLAEISGADDGVVGHRRPNARYVIRRRGTRIAGA